MKRIALGAAVAAFAVVAGPFAASATAKGTLVVPGQSIGGVKLGMSKKKVRKSRPVGLKKPTRRSSAGELYVAPSGATLSIGYRSKKVFVVAAGAGPWATANGLAYGASPPLAASLVPGCVFYSKENGVRVPNPPVQKGQSCELVASPTRYFYLTFNVADFTPGSTAVLAGFSLSKILIP